jgi:hypothetical protein
MEEVGYIYMPTVLEFVVNFNTILILQWVSLVVRRSVGNVAQSGPSFWAIFILNADIPTNCVRLLLFTQII